MEELERKIEILEQRINDIERVENHSFIEQAKDRIVEGTVTGGNETPRTAYTQEVSSVLYPEEYDEMVDLIIDGKTYRIGYYNA